MIGRYRALANVAALVATGVFVLLVLTAFEYLPDLQFAGLSLWPVVIGLLVVSIFVASWAIAKAKGRSGWLGLALPFFDVVGLAVLFKFRERGGEVAPRERGR